MSVEVSAIARHAHCGEILGSPHKIVEVVNSWAFSGIGATIRSRQSNRVDVNPIFIAGVK